MRMFQGYRRPNGTIGVRNHVLVVPSVMCANHVVERIGRAVPDVVTVNHPTGCAQIGADFEQTKRTIAGFAAHPNVAAVLVVGLGCETNDSKELASRSPRGVSEWSHRHPRVQRHGEHDRPRP